MRKVYLKVEMTVCVIAEDGRGAEDIMDGLDVSVTSDDENVDVDYHEVDNYYVTDSK
jgi:hypothetical protein